MDYSNDVTVPVRFVRTFSYTFTFIQTSDLNRILKQTLRSIISISIRKCLAFSDKFYSDFNCFQTCHILCSVYVLSVIEDLGVEFIACQGEQ